MGQMLASSQQPQDGPDNPQVAWWCKLLAKVVGTLAGIICLITAIWTFVSLKPRCIVAGVLQLIGAAIVIMFEAPICCAYLDITKPIATFAEKRTFLQRAIIYAGIAIIPLALCFGLSTIFGCGLVFAAGVIYGLMALGKKADRDQMLNQAAAQQHGSLPPAAAATSDDSKVNLMEEQHGGVSEWDQAASGGYGGNQQNYGGGQQAPPQGYPGQPSYGGPQTFR